MIRNLAGRIALVTLLLVVAATPWAQAPLIGRLSFPTSATGRPQDAFDRGVLYLHNFEYDDAIIAFPEAQTLSPGFAMAYWGEAMTYNHPVWMEQDAVAARAALSRLAPTPELRRAKAPTAREQAWLSAVETLYAEDRPGGGSAEAQKQINQPTGT